MDDYKHLKGKPTEKTEIELEEERLGGFVQDQEIKEPVGVSDDDLKSLQSLQNDPQSLLELKNEISPAKVEPKVEEVEEEEIEPVQASFDQDTFSTNLRNELQGRLSSIL